MLANHKKKELEKVAKNMCKIHNLQHVYFTHKLGKRRHYLAGYGQEMFSNTHHLDITKKTILFWQGNLIEKDISIIICRLVPLARKVEREFN